MEWDFKRAGLHFGRPADCVNLRSEVRRQADRLSLVLRLNFASGSLWVATAPVDRPGGTVRPLFSVS